MTDTLHIHTDGSFDTASRLGGWAFVVHFGERQLHAEWGKATGTSNNTFEVLAVLNAMSWVAAEAPALAVTLWTDSVHVFEGCTRWKTIWRTNGWKRITANSHARRRQIPDVEIWQKLDALLERCPHVVLQWCKGHAGTAGNELAHSLAKGAVRRFTNSGPQALWP